MYTKPKYEIYKVLKVSEITLLENNNYFLKLLKVEMNSMFTR